MRQRNIQKKDPHRSAPAAMTLRMAVPLCTALLLLAACDVKDPIYNTAHPDHGQITLTTDWTQRTAGIDIPAAYTIQAGDYTETASGTTHTLDHLFPPGACHLRVYNTPEHIAVNGATVTVAKASGNDGVGPFIQPMPGWLFTSALDTTIEADTDHHLTVPMHQQIRQLTLFITPAGGTTDKIERIEGYLTGAAAVLDLDNGTHSAALNVALAFTRVTDGADAGKWTATVRLLGVAGTEQMLHGRIFFTGNDPLPVDLTDADGNEGISLATELAAFNADKTTPLTLGGSIVQTPTGTDFTATITGWTVQETITGEGTPQ